MQLYFNESYNFLWELDGKDHYNLNPQSKDFISKLGASIWAQQAAFRDEEDREEILGFNTNEEIEKGKYYSIYNK